MCVICVAQEKRMTKDHIDKMWATNKDGGGIAWREHGRVQWRKGLKEDELRDLCLTVPLPYVAHFRIASCGGVCDELTHPFPIQKDAPLDLRGSTTGRLLFHNGHHTGWKDRMLNMAINNRLELPDGPWSDSRMMAWVASYCTPKILPFFDEKLVVFSFKDLDVWGLGWTKVDDLYVSNRNWEHGHTIYQNTYHNLVCAYKQCKRTKFGATRWCENHQGGQEKSESSITVFNRDIDAKRPTTGGSSAPSTFRGSHDPAGSGETEQKAVEKVAKPLGETGAGQREGFPSHAALIAGEAAINFVRRLNPKPFRSPGVRPQHVETCTTEDDDLPYSAHCMM